MNGQPELKNLQDLLDRLANLAEDSDRVSIEAVLKAVGRRAFGPVLLVPGLMALSPLSGIPGVPTIVGGMVLLITGQLLLGRSEFWLPQFVLRRSAPRSRIEKAIRFLRPVARFIDRLIKPRLPLFVQGPAVYVIAALCLLVSLISPLLELVPLAITGVGAAVSAFGLGLISDDGALTFLASVFGIGTAIFAARALF